MNTGVSVACRDGYAEETGRNGTFEICRVSVDVFGPRDAARVTINGVSSTKGVTLNGGFSMSLTDAARLFRVASMMLDAEATRGDDERR